MTMKLRLLPHILAALLVLGGILAPSASAKLEVELDVQKVSEHAVLVTLSWTATIRADRDWEACEVVISFRDLRDREIHRITKRVSLKAGRNEITDHEICEAAVWEKTRKFAGKLNCGF